jgi:TonB-linked SusC/RagA family outer membrane protein
LSLIKVVFMKKLIMILTCILASVGLSVAQTTRVSGTVIDDTGETVIGASVVAKGTTVGIITDLDGKFSFNIPSDKKTLVISLIGMKTKEVAAGTDLRIVMDPDSKLMDEVVVTGYGNVKKASFTGAASVLSASKLENVPSVSLEAKLAGATAGISAGSATGQPGAVESIRIRGLGSVNGSIEPLYVIDGVPMSSNNMSEFNYSQSGTSVLSTLNSNDIESITIIKDAAAASLYGSRAANGVVVITTKGGKAEKTTVSLRANWGFSDMAINYRPTLGGDARRDLLYQGLINYHMNNEKNPTEASAKAYADKNINTYAEKPETGWEDWRERLLRTGTQQSYEVNMQGGNNKTNFYSSLAYTDMEGITLQSDFQRITGRLNLTHKMDKFTFGANVTFANTKQNVNNEGTSFASPIMAISMSTSPQDYAYNPDGSFNLTNKFNMFGNALANPLYSAKINYNKNELNRFLGSLSAKYDILDNLSLKETLSYDFVQTNSRVWWDPRSNDGRTSKGVYQRVMSNQKILTSQTHVMYNKSFDKVHNFDALVGYELEKFKYDYTYSNGSGYPTFSKPEIENAAITRASSHVDESRMISYVGSANYNYDNKYYVGFSFRRDGSSKFGKDNRWGDFWSVSGAWRLSQEKFMTSVEKVLTDAKLRLSYGTNGNMPPRYYGFMDVYEFGYKYNNNPGSAEGRLAYTDLKWEKSFAGNIGVDLTFIDRINVTLDLYSKKSKDLLLDRPVSMLTGFTKTFMNIGEMTNKGFELEIKTTNISNKDFYWATSFNIAHNKNKLTKIDGVQQEFKTYSPRLVHRIGESFNSLYAYEYAGVDPKTGKELFYKNKGDNPRETTTNSAEAEQVIIGRVDPTVQGGLTNTFSYKGIDLGFTFTYSFGGHLYDNASWINSDGGSDNYEGNVPRYYNINDMWQKEGDNAKLPQFVYGNKNTPSSRWMHTTDHIRLKNVTLGYTIPKNYLKKLSLSKARIYASAVNLFTIKSKALMVDPELPVDPDPARRAIGVVTFQTPPLRTVTFGIEVSF